MEGTKSLISDLLVSIVVYQCKFGILVRDLDVTPRIRGTKVQLDGRLRCHTAYSHTTVRCYVAGLSDTCVTGVTLISSLRVLSLLMRVGSPVEFFLRQLEAANESLQGLWNVDWLRTTLGLVSG
ncbi:hypothetical protein Tco_0308913 [Tanacetum coccineum]